MPSYAKSWLAFPIYLFLLTGMGSVLVGCGGGGSSGTQSSADPVVVDDPTDADLSVAKTVDNSTTQEGDTIVYTVTLTNNGPLDATGVSLSDVLPAGLNYAADDAAASGTFYDSATGLWTIGGLNNAASAMLHITATVNPGTGGTTITNTANVTASDQPDSVPGNDSAVVELTVVAPLTSADLAVVKVADDANPAEGGTVVFTVTVTNNGPSDATGVVLSDPLPAGLTYVGDDSGGAYNSGTGLWTVGTLLNGSLSTLHITATVDAGAGGSTLTNTASVSALNEPDPITGNDSASAVLFGVEWPTTGWTTASPDAVSMDLLKLEQARDYALTGGGAGYITRAGKLVMSWGDDTQLFAIRSSTKSIGATVLGLALQDNLLSVDDLAQQYLADIGIPPDTNATTGWLDEITLRHLLTHTAGFDKPGGYIDLLFQPGTTWSYSDGGANWLADLLTVLFGQDLRSLMFDRVFSVLGITASDLTWRNNNFRDTTINGITSREFASGINADVDALARIGYLYLRRGMWDGQRILPESFIDQARQPVPGVVGLPVNDPSNHFNASDHYGLLWWNNGDGTIAGVPEDTYWAWGLGDSLIVVIPSLDIVAARAGSGWRQGWNSDYTVVEPFFRAIVESVNDLTDVAVSKTVDDALQVEGGTVVFTVTVDVGTGGSMLTNMASVSALNEPDSIAGSSTHSFTIAVN